MSTPPSEFTNMTELIDYLAALEKRVTSLETENQILRSSVSSADPGVSLQKARIVDIVNGTLPHTGLLSDSFLYRAFTVWGHYFVAQLIIGLGLGLIYFIGFMLLAFSGGR